MKQIIILGLIVIFVSSTHLMAQSHYLIKGTVFNNVNSEMVSDATIHAVGSDAYTISNKDGNFEISVLEQDTIMISRIGYENKVVALSYNMKRLSIGLDSIDNSLDDVTINTGYQKLKPNEVNGSYIVIDNKMLNEQTGRNILDRLKGVTSSLLYNIGKRNGNPQSNTGISIRGYSTINGPLDPLIIVDDFIYDGDINNINPNDVESVTVLKDAAAASIWGARAGNGVIVITTKKGKFNQKLQVDFNADIIITEKPDLFSQPSISSSDFIDFEQFLFNKGYYNSKISRQKYAAISPAVQIFLDRRNGDISAIDSASRIESLKKIDNRYQFEKYFYRKGITKQYSLNLRGGSQKIGWLISGTYDKDIANLHSEYSKINLRFENTYRPTKNLTVNAGVYYTNSTNTSGMTDYNAVSEIANSIHLPYMDLVGAGGTSIPILHYFNPKFIDTLGGGKLLNLNYYPLEDYKYMSAKTNTEDLVGHINLNYSIIKGLNARLLYQYEKQNVNLNRLYDTGSYYMRDMINSFSQLDRASGLIKYIVPNAGLLKKNAAQMNSYNFRGQLDFDRSLGHNNKIDALAGFEIRDQQNEMNGNMFYGYKSNPLSFVSNMDYSTGFPNFITGLKRQIQSGESLSGTRNRFVSFFSNFSYSFKNTYTVSGSVRKDGSNIFGANTNDKWKPLWSTGIGWRLSNESFYNLAWMPFLRFSATYGVSGNVDLSKTAKAIGVYQANTLYNNLLGIYIQYPNNPDLRWEKSYQFNFKLDFSLSKEVINGSIEYYRKWGTDLYAKTPYDYTTFGSGSFITANAADMKGRGVDVGLHSNNLNRNIKWTTDFIFNYNFSVTSKYFTDGSTSIATLLSDGDLLSPVIGKPLYAIAAYKWGGLDSEGNPQGYLDGKLSTDYKGLKAAALENGLKSGVFVYVGSATPNYFGSLLNRFTFKGISLSFNLRYKFGYFLRKPTFGYVGLAASGSGLDYYKSRWKKPGDENFTNVPSVTYPLDANRDTFFGYSDINVIKGDHIRLQFVNLSYTFLKHNKRLPFKSLQMYVNASNLGIVWRANTDHVDPDYANVIPNPKSFTLGVKANF